MLRLREAPPPWNISNRERWVIFEAEYFSLQSWYSKKTGDTLKFLQKTWVHLRSRAQGVEFAELQAVARQIGGRGNLQSAKCRWEILWPREMAWPFMSVDGSKVVWDGV